MTATVYEGRVARVHKDGDALVYGEGDKVRHEYRDAAELRRVAGQLAGKPLTLLHPDGLIRDGATPHVVGKILDGRLDADTAVASFMVTDPAGKAAIDGGVHELSMGYACNTDADGNQSDTYVDHVALVPRARCGPSCSLRADCAGCAAPAGTPLACQCKTHAVKSAETMADPVVNSDAELNAKERHELPGHMFAIPGREGMPLEDEGHVKDAMARFNQEKWKGPAERKAAYHHIIARAHQLGIDPSGFEKKFGGRLDSEDKTMDELQTRLDAALAAAAAEKTRADAAEAAKTAAEVTAANAEAAAKQATDALAAEKARADAAEAAKTAAEAKAHADADDAFNARVNERVEILKAADTVLGAKTKDGVAIDRSKMSDRDIKVAIIKHVDGTDVPEDKKIDFVDGVYAGAVGRHEKAQGSVAGTRVAIQQLRTDVQSQSTTGGKAVETELQSQMSARIRAAWQTPSK